MATQSAKLRKPDHLLIEQNEGIRNFEPAVGGNSTPRRPPGDDRCESSLGGTIVLNATTNISLTEWPLDRDHPVDVAEITAPMVLINSGGPPPADPIDRQDRFSPTRNPGSP